MGDILDEAMLDHTRAYQRAEPIVPSDTVDLPHITKAIYVGSATAGQAIKVQSSLGVGPVTLVNVVQGDFLKIEVSRVYATGTTATNLIAFY